MRGNVRKIVRIVSCIMKRFLKLIMKNHDRKKNIGKSKDHDSKIMKDTVWKVKI